MTVGSLFAGIGGFDLGFERAGFDVRWQVEINAYCRAVLRKHWPSARRYADVRRVGAHNLEPVDVICGGFPCQDISVAGAGAGLEGQRSGLWRDYRRIVRELRPRYVVVENVAALLDRGIGRVLGDLAESGYHAEWCCLPTGRSMGHDRERVFIVADIVREGLQERGDTDQVGAYAPRIFTRERFAGGIEGIDPRQKWADRPLLGRGVHGIPRRVDRVKSLGNAIVPQIAQWIAERIKEAEREAAA
jgi:DNA (cytosine-5)-methyltransferase 1